MKVFLPFLLDTLEPVQALPFGEDSAVLATRPKRNGRSRMQGTSSASIAANDTKHETSNANL
jgi:hypothetical protein